MRTLKFFFLFIIILHIILQGFTNSKMLIRVWTPISCTYLYFMIVDEPHKIQGVL